MECYCCYCLVSKSCPTLCDTMDYSPPGYFNHGISQASTLEWVSISFSSLSSLPRNWTQVSCLSGGFFTTNLPGKPKSWDQFSSVQLLSHVWLFGTPLITAHQASLSITNSRSLLKLMSIELEMPSSHLILCQLLLLLPPIPPRIRVFSNESTLRRRWPKYWSFSFSIIPSNEHPELISFRMDWLDLLAVQGNMVKSISQSQLLATDWCVEFPFSWHVNHSFSLLCFHLVLPRNSSLCFLEQHWSFNNFFDSSMELPL